MQGGREVVGEQLRGAKDGYAKAFKLGVVNANVLTKPLTPRRPQLFSLDR